MRNEGQAYDLGGHGLVTHDELNPGTSRCECRFDIAHGDGTIGGWAKAAGGDDANLTAACVGDDSSFAGGGSAFGLDANAFALGSRRNFFLHASGADETTFIAAALLN